MKNVFALCCMMFLFWNVNAQFGAVADFTFAQPDPYDTTIEFTNASQNATSYSWDLGNGILIPTFANAVNPVYTYDSPGTYTVCLTAIPPFGSSDQTCHDVTVTCPQPVADYFVNQLSSEYCTGTVSFYNESMDYTSLLWDFGDGSTSTDTSPQHTFTSSGDYVVSLTAFNPCNPDGVTQTFIIDVIKDTPPSYVGTSGFDVLALDPYIIDFESNYTSTYAGLSNNPSLSWDYGDGTTGGANNTFHIYDAVGTYNVCLTASNVCGADYYCQNVAITCATPTADFTTNQSDAFVPEIQFTNTSNENSFLGSPTYSWDFGDGFTSSQENPSHMYAVPGTYTVSLYYQNYCAFDTYEMTVTVTGGIHVDANATGANDGTSWTNAFTDLQDALAIGEGRPIYVAEGTYYPTDGTSRAIFFDIPSGTTIEGGYPTGGGTRDAELYETILSGDINQDGMAAGNSFHVVRLQNVSDIILDGIIIQDGNADNANSFARARGGGIYSKSASNITITNCRIEGNEAVYGGGVFATLSPDFTISYSLVQSNIADYGSALYHSNETTMYLYKSRIIDNNSLVRCAIEINNSLHTEMIQCVVANNASQNANAIGFIATNRDQTCVMHNNTILGETKNKFLITMQVGFNDVLTVDMYNTIVGHQNPNFTKTVRDYNNGTLNFNSYACYFQGNAVIGTGNNNLFSETDGDLMLNGDYSLHPCSPGVDDGWPAFASSNLPNYTDIDGNLIVTNNVDIGAYEAQSSCGVINRMAGDSEMNTKQDLGLNVFPNPTTDLIQVLLPDSEASWSIRIFDHTGRILKNIHSENNFTPIEISFQDLPQGQYWLNASNEIRNLTVPIQVIR